MAIGISLTGYHCWDLGAFACRGVERPQRLSGFIFPTDAL